MLNIKIGIRIKSYVLLVLTIYKILHFSLVCNNTSDDENVERIGRNYAFTFGATTLVRNPINNFIDADI